MKWAAVIPLPDARQLGAIRLLAGVEVCPQDQCLWLRGGELDDDMDLALRKLSGARRFVITEDGHLLQMGDRVPCGKLPAGEWVKLSAYLVPHPQAAALAGHVPSSVPVKLVPSGEEKPANMLLTHLDAWATCAAGLSEIRLRNLTFAVASDGRVLVRGKPLPPIPGMGMVWEAGLAVPCGYAWTPQLDAEVLRAAFGVEESDLVVLWPDGGVFIVSEQCFVAASRSAVRLTAKEFGASIHAKGCPNPPSRSERFGHG